VLQASADWTPPQRSLFTWCHRFNSPSAAMTSQSLAKFPKSCGSIAVVDPTSIPLSRLPATRDDYIHSVTFLIVCAKALGTRNASSSAIACGRRSPSTRPTSEFDPRAPSSHPSRSRAHLRLTEGNIFHATFRFDQLFFMRPVAGGRNTAPHREPYLCAQCAHPAVG